MTLIVPETPRELGFNPLVYPAWRPGQREITQHIINWYFDPKGSKVFMLEAPTGIGKSLIAGAVAVMLDEDADHKHHTLITTTTLNLQRQYTNETLVDMATSAWGRANYECVAFGGDCSAAPCTVGWKCSEKRNCHYYNARDAAHLSPTTILNTAFFLTAANNVELNEKLAEQEPWREAAYIYSGINLLIHDEAHIIERAVRSVVEGEFNRRFFERNGMRLPTVTEYGTWDAWIDNHYAAVKDIADDYTERAKAAATIGQKIDDYNGRQAVAASLQMTWIKYSLLPTRPLIEGVSSKTNNITFKPIWGKHFANRFLWRHGDRHLLMSASIPYPKYLAETLGLEDDDWSFVRLNSPFPLMSRRIVYDPVMRVNVRTTPTEFAKLITRMDDIIDKHHTTEKGMIHTVSYARAESIMMRSRHHRRMITHESGKGKKERAIQEFLDAGPGAILVSPAVGVGEDFGRGENCRFQFFVKYPIPSLGDPVTKARAEEVPDSLWFEADMAFIQAVGRGTRSATDFCVNYVLDAGAGRRMAKFPESLRATIVKGGA